MWAVCPGQCLPKRRKTAGIDVSRDDLLLWQNPVRCFQGEAQDFSEATAAVPGAVDGLAPPIPQPAAYGRPASAGQDAGAGPSELLCDYGQLRELSAVYASDTSGAVQMAESAEPTQVVYLGRVPPSPTAGGLAPGASAREPEPFCTAEWLNEELDMGKPFVRFCEGLRYNQCMAEILWHRRETRRQTENTNFTPIAPKTSVYSTKTQTHVFSSVCRPAIACST